MLGGIAAGREDRIRCAEDTRLRSLPLQGFAQDRNDTRETVEPPPAPQATEPRSRKMHANAFTISSPESRIGIRLRPRPR